MARDAARIRRQRCAAHWHRCRQEKETLATQKPRRQVLFPSSRNARNIHPRALVESGAKKHRARASSLQTIRLRDHRKTNDPRNQPSTATECFDDLGREARDRKSGPRRIADHHCSGTSTSTTPTFEIPAVNSPKQLSEKKLPRRPEKRGRGVISALPTRSAAFMADLSAAAAPRIRCSLSDLYGLPHQRSGRRPLVEIDRLLPTWRIPAPHEDESDHRGAAFGVTPNLDKMRRSCHGRNDFPTGRRKIFRQCNARRT